MLMLSVAILKDLTSVLANLDTLETEKRAVVNIKNVIFRRWRISLIQYYYDGVSYLFDTGKGRELLGDL